MCIRDSCAGVATAKDGFVAFGATAVRKLTARKVVTQTRPLTPPSKPLEDHGDALEATLRNVVDGKSAEPLSSIFAAAPSDKIQKAATAVIAAPYASNDQARAAFDAAIEGFWGQRRRFRGLSGLPCRYLAHSRRAEGDEAVLRRSDARAINGGCLLYTSPSPRDS